MSECEHRFKDGEVHTAMSRPPEYECGFCEMDRLRTQLEAAVRERDEAREERDFFDAERIKVVEELEREQKSLATAVEALECITRCNSNEFSEEPDVIARKALAKMSIDTAKPVTGAEFVEGIHKAIPNAFDEMTEPIGECTDLSNKCPYPNCPKHGGGQAGSSGGGKSE